MKKQVLLLASVLLLLLVTGCYKKEVVPSADFSFHSSNDSIVPDTLSFFNHSQNASSYSWDFGDNHSSTDINPIHIYTAKGTYLIVLKAYSKSGEQWAIKNANVIIQ